MVAQQQTNSNLPTLPGGFYYPAPTVPPTANAPYMQSSHLPQDFVFIIVGAALAFVAFLILAWRIGTAWSINRSFTRPGTGLDHHYAPVHHGMDMKKPSGAGAPNSVRPASSHNMDVLAVPRSFSQSANSSLFFSPTAEAAKYNSVGRPQSLQMAGQYLPAGHYRNNSEGGR